MTAKIPSFGSLPQPIAIVAHDAGAANILIEWLKASDVHLVRAHMAGPAEKLWKQAFPSRSIVTLEKSLDGAAQLVSGTGWESTLEHEARRKARSLGIPVVAVLDHWVNYRQRFIRDGEEVLPDDIWVSDDYALEIAQSEFGRVSVHKFSNCYLEVQVDAIRELGPGIANPQAHRILYALEPIRLEWETADSRPGEFQALDFFVDNLDALGIAGDVKIRLRPHPSDPPGKYDEWLACQSNLPVKLAPDEPIANAVAWSNTVAGCESYVLIIGVEAGRRTISTLPPWGNRLRLPQTEIIRLCDLAGNQS